MMAASLAAFFALNVWAIFTGRLTSIVPALYCGISIATFIAYAADKAAARNGQRRIKEATLHMLALAGGWPGAVAAQRLLRHKSSKPAFQAKFWMTVAGNGVALIGLVIVQMVYFAG